MKCPSCGRENEPDLRFCQQCGEPLVERGAESTSPPVEELVCAACGHANRPGVRFCEECGEPLAKVVPEEVAEPALVAVEEVVCSACGHANRPDVRFCEECGEPLVEVRLPAPPPLPVRRRRALLIVGLIGVPALVALIAVVLVFRPILGRGELMRLPNVGDLSTITEDEAAALGASIVEQRYPQLVDVAPTVNEKQVQGHRIYDVVFSANIPAEGGEYRWTVIIAIDTDSGRISIFESN